MIPRLSLEDDFKTVAERLGLPSSTLPKLNTSAGGSYRDLYTDKTMGAVHEMFREDIETYGYTF